MEAHGCTCGGDEDVLEWTGVVVAQPVNIPDAAETHTLNGETRAI